MIMSLLVVSTLCNPSGVYEAGYRSEINRFGDALYLQERGNLGSGNATGNLYMCSNGGNVGIGKASASYKLDVNGTCGATAFYQSSDARLKDNVETILRTLRKTLLWQRTL